MSQPRLSVRGVTFGYGRKCVLDDVSFELNAGQALGVVGANGAGKTTLLRVMVGCLAPRAGEIRINGVRISRTPSALSHVAYFAGDASMPGTVRAVSWGSLGAGEEVTVDRRPVRALSRGTRQLLGLRTVLGRHPLDVIVLDEPWEGLDPDASRWLSMTLETKRDRGSAVVLSSHRLHDLAGLCDAYLFLTAARATLLRTHEIAGAGSVTADDLRAVFDEMRRCRDSSHSLDPRDPA